MAIPAITNNSPSAGRIAWGAFNIQLNGVTYSVPSGSTNQRWVWWNYNAGAPSIQAGPEVPDTLLDDDLVLFANKNGIGVRVQSTSFVDGELLVDGSIFAEALSTNLINSQHIVTAGLDAGVIKFGTMHGDRIEANTLTIGKIASLPEELEARARVDEVNKALHAATSPIDDPSVLGSLGRWTMSTSVPSQYYSSLQMAEVDFLGAMTPVMHLVGSASNSTVYSGYSATSGVHEGHDLFELNPSKAYMVSAWFKDSEIVPGTQMYFGLHTFGESRSSSLANGSLTKSTGGVTQSSNIYFKSWGADSPLEWTRVVAYFLPSDFPAEVGRHLGEGNSANVIMNPETRWGRLRILNYTANVHEVYVAHPMVLELDPDLLIKTVNANIAAADAMSRADQAHNRWAPEGQTTIDGGNITTNTIVGNKIMGQTIGAEKLVVGDLANMAEINESYAIGPLYDAVHTISNGWSTRTTNTSSYFMFRNNHGPLPFKTGDRIKVSFDVYADAAVAASMSLWTYGNATVSQSLGTIPITTAVKTIEMDAEVTVDTNGKTTFLIGLNGVSGRNVFLRNVRAYRMNAGELIVDGSIIGDHIKGDTITGNKLQGETITGREIAANSITTSKLIISDLTNLVVDGELLDETAANWFEVGPGKISRVKPSGQPAYLSNKNQSAATHIFFRNENVFSLSEGDEFYISVEASTPATNTQDLNLRLTTAVYDQNGASSLWRNIEEGDFVVPPGSDWEKLEGVLKITEPALATGQFNPFVHGITAAAGTQEIRLRNMVVRRKNAGKLIVDGTVEGKHIEMNTITADQIDVGALTGDLLAAEVVMSGLVRAGDLDDDGNLEGGYSEMGARGILTVNSEGETIASLPTDAANGGYLKAHIELLSAEVHDNFTMRGTNNQIATEGELTLSVGVEAPSVPPTLQQVWDQVHLNKTTAVPPHVPNAGFNLGTFAFNPAQATAIAWNTTWSCWVVTQQRSNGFRVWRFTSSGAIMNNISSGRPWVDDYNDRSKVSVCYNTQASGEAYLFKSGDQWYIWAPENINKIPASWIIDKADRPPALGWDAVNNRYMLVQNNGGGSGTIFIRRFTVVSGANFPNANSTNTQNFEAASGVTKRINGVVYGTQTGITGTVVNVDEYQTVYVFNTSGVAQDDEGTARTWLKPGAALGLAHNGTQFASLDSAGVVTLYENWTWTGLDRNVWVGASAYDSDTAGDQANPHIGQLAGRHETPVGTMRGISLYKRSKLRITMPETNDSGGNDDPDKWRIYFKRGGSSAPTDKNLLKMVADIGSPTSSTSITITADATGVAPPGGIRGQSSALNNFPGADPGRIESAKLDSTGNPLILLRGDGAGRLGPFAWNSSGKDANDSGWIAPTFLNGWSNYGSTFSTAAYRKVGNRVFLRGLIRNGTSITASMFTLPAGFRPPNTMMMSAITNVTTLNVTGDGQKSTSGPDDNETTSTSSHTHHMKKHSHNVTYNIAGNTGNVAVRLDVSADGTVKCGDTQSATGYISLDGISFFID